MRHGHSDARSARATPIDEKKERTVYWFLFGYKEILRQYSRKTGHDDAQIQISGLSQASEIAKIKQSEHK
jgi:hypothetical protein